MGSVSTKQVTEARDALLSSLSEVSSDNPVVILIIGPQGVGKTSYINTALAACNPSSKTLELNVGIAGARGTVSFRATRAFSAGDQKNKLYLIDMVGMEFPSHLSPAWQQAITHILKGVAFTQEADDQQQTMTNSIVLIDDNQVVDEAKLLARIAALPAAEQNAVSAALMVAKASYPANGSSYTGALWWKQAVANQARTHILTSISNFLTKHTRAEVAPAICFTHKNATTSIDNVVKTDLTSFRIVTQIEAYHPPTGQAYGPIERDNATDFEVLNQLKAIVDSVKLSPAFHQ